MASIPESQASSSSLVVLDPANADGNESQVAGPSSQVLFNRNPQGKNQHKDCRESLRSVNVLCSVAHLQTARDDDPRIPQLLAEYHRRLITNKNDISALLLAEHGIIMSCVQQSKISTTCITPNVDL